MNNQFDIIQLSQLTSKKVYITTIAFKDLIKRVKFTVRQESTIDIFSGSSLEINEYYQRLIKEQRTKEIASFILSNIYHKKIESTSYTGLFPSAIILSYSSSEYTEYDKFEKSLTDDSLDPKGVFLTDKNIYIPANNEGLVVDGQHRLAGFKLLWNLATENKIKVGSKQLNEVYPELSNEYIINEIENYSFPCTILVDFDLWEQGRVFADVNFKQKPVNRSLYYDIFGSFPDPDKNDIYLAHHYTLNLQNSDQSPLKNKIKLLGSGPGYFSQAFLVEALIDTFKKGHAFNEILFDFANSGNMYKELPKFFRAYFSALKEEFPNYWPTDDQNSRSYKAVLLKTNGLGAIIRLSENIFKLIKQEGQDLLNTDENQYKTFIKVYLNLIKDNGERYFSENSAFAKSGSKGLQQELYNLMLNDLNIKLREHPVQL
ncbi:MAG TPA: DGQHR domain-containing protein [Flavipsychrobacter sp.]|nr:DGQHR domain-containing protein [Flavipsychrobacter sp.]